MGYPVNHFEVQEPQLGLSIFNKDFQPNLTLSKTSRNITTGINLGYSPRYGMSPLPAHSTTDAAGLMGSEGGSYDVQNRTRFFDIIPISMALQDTTDLSVKKNHYLFVIGDSSRLIFSFAGHIVMGLRLAEPTPFDGLLSYTITHNDEPGVLLLSQVSPSMTLSDYLTIPATLLYCNTAVLSVTGKDQPMRHLFGASVTTADATHTALPNFVRYVFGRAGVPPEYNNGSFKKNTRNLKFFDLFVAGGAGDYSTELAYEYDYDSYQVTSSTFLPTTTTGPLVFYNDTTPNISLSTTATRQVNRLDGATPAYDLIKAVYLVDNDCVCNSSYNAVFAAPGKAIMVIIQDWFRNPDGTVLQYIDPTNRGVWTHTYPTASLSATDLYKEDGIAKATTWQNWPQFSSSTPLAKNSVAPRNGFVHVTLGDANSGVLRKNSVYEITFSYFDKRLGYETNVGVPAQILTGNDDFVALSLFRDRQTTPPTNDQFSPAAFKDDLPFPQTGPAYQETQGNYLEFRVYYRALGTFEWLPALFIDHAQAIRDPNLDVLWACQQPIAGLPGGQPGGFNDYSQLPSDNYIDVQVFQNRVFWMSGKNLVFSLRNEPFSYPLRNAVACPLGEFKGMIVHTFYGQAQQNAHLIVFGSEQTYSCRFSGDTTEQPIVISPDVTANYPVDGSDFIIEPRTSITAFSSRAAVVAEGFLYFWGPTGVYRDNGVDIPEKLSGALEPDIYNLYDSTAIDTFIANYSAQTKEIVWTFKSSDTTITTTQGLVLNIVTGEFFYQSFNGQIDNIINVPIVNTSDMSLGVQGYRTIASVRSSGGSIQRGVFFDYRNRAGDFFPGTENLVKQVTLQNALTNTWRLFLGGGFNLSGIAVNDAITIAQSFQYTSTTSSGMLDNIAQVAAVGANYLDVILPLGTQPSGNFTLDYQHYFPIWHQTNNAISYLLESNIWSPAGMRYWARWLYLHLLYKINLLPAASALTTTLSYKSPLATAYASNVLTFAANSLGNFQVYTMLQPDNQVAEGQGLKISISGSQFGSEWVLQYLGADAAPMQGDFLRTYEG